MSKPVILCVDDEQMVRECLREQLLDHFAAEYTIETAESGADAIELFEDLLAEQKEVPLIISDCIMPDMNGDQLLGQIHAIAPKTVKVMLTGQASSTAVINAVNYANLYRYIPKPWEQEDLVLTVTEALRGYFKDKHIEEQNRALQDMNTMLIERTVALSQALGGGPPGSNTSKSSDLDASRYAGVQIFRFGNGLESKSLDLGTWQPARFKHVQI